MSLKCMNTEVEQLVEACARKDPKAQKQLYDQYAPTLMGLCMRYTHSRDEAQDLLHDGFIKIFENIGKLKKPQSLETWMRQVMISQSINYLSRRRTIIYTDLNLIEETIPQEEEEENGWDDRTKGISMEQIVNAIQSMPEQYQKVFNMHDVEEIDYPEIARIMKMRESTIRSILLRARRYLRKKLEKRIQ